MSKKKAIKITTATAIAASAFVAVAPTQSEAATSSVDKAITKATNQMAKAYDTYHKTAKNEGKLPATGTIRNQVALAKDYYAAAEKEIAKNGGSKTKKAAYTKTLNAKKYFLDRAEAYLAAINTNLNPAKTAFTAAVETGKAKTVVPAKAALVKDVEAFEATVAKIYGPDVRELLLEKYATPATELSNSVNDELKVYEAYKKIEAGKFEDLAKTEELITLVKTEADALKTKTTKLATTLAAVVAKNNAAYEAAKTPVVKEIKVTSDKTVEVKVETARTDLTAKHFTVLVDGTAVTPTEVKSDAKGEVYTLTVAGLEGKDGKVSVNGKEAAFEFAAPAVKEVSAINAKEVEVTFNKAVDATDAAVTTNYVLDGNNPTAVDLAKDGKSAVLTFGTAEATSKVFTVKAIQTAKDANVTTEVFTKVYSYKDEKKPEIVNVTSKTSGSTATSITIEASEPIAPGATLKVDGVYAAVTFVGKTATVTGLTLDATKSHTIEVLNLTDLAATPNTTVYTTKTFAATVDAVKPTATVTAQGDKNILVTFSKSMDDATVVAALVNGVVKNESLGAVATNTAVVVPNTDNKQYVIEVTGTLYDTASSRTLNVVLPGTMTDSLGNTFDTTTKSVSLSKDSVKPVATGFSVVKAASGNVTDLVVNFSEGLDAATAGAIANPTIIDADGVLVTSFLGGLTSDAVTAGDKKVTYSVTTPAKVYGEYEFTFGSALVSDQAETGNTSASFKYNYNFGTQAPGTGTFDLATAASTTATSNIIEVDFGTAVKGGNVANSATLLSSYTLNGKPLPNGTTITLNAAKEVATITLPANGVATTDTAAVFTVSGVKSTTGLNVNPFVDTVRVADNTSPELKGAQVVGNSLILTFSETMGATATDAAIADVLANYEITSAGTKVVAGTGVATASLVAGDAKKVQISFTNTTGTNFDATKTITVETLNTGDLADANSIAVTAGNKVTATR